jgi:hypothetical protein
MRLHSGLVVTTAVGFLTIAASSVVYLGLPKIPSKNASQLKQGVLGPMKECKLFFSRIRPLHTTY